MAEAEDLFGMALADKEAARRSSIFEEVRTRYVEIAACHLAGFGWDWIAERTSINASTLAKYMWDLKRSGYGAKHKDEIESEARRLNPEYGSVSRQAETDGAGDESGPAATSEDGGRAGRRKAPKPPSANGLLFGKDVASVGMEPAHLPLEQHIAARLRSIAAMRLVRMRWPVICEHIARERGGEVPKTSTVRTYCYRLGIKALLHDREVKSLAASLRVAILSGRGVDSLKTSNARPAQQPAPPKAARPPSHAPAPPPPGKTKVEPASTSNPDHMAVEFERFVAGSADAFGEMPMERQVGVATRLWILLDKLDSTDHLKKHAKEQLLAVSVLRDCLEKATFREGVSMEELLKREPDDKLAALAAEIYKNDNKGG